jgi:U3 small nucleolar RNA-associated protein 25
MRRNEEAVSNKKRFFDQFGPDDDESESGKSDSEQDGDDEETKKDTDGNKKADDFNFLLNGNTDDHFRIGLSVSKKSLKLFTHFYSSDIIIASPLGLKSIIGGAEGDSEHDHDFLSSIEVLIVDNADVLMMQNWEHVLTVFENLHLQPRQNHDVDFSRVRYWLLEGHARYYRQTLIFSRIPAPPINSIFNKYCQNFSGKCQIDVLKSSRFQSGTICHIGFQLGQIFNRIECDNPADLPQARFNFFIDKILPKFRDEMMSHTLVFIPSYFDYVQIRNHFKKNDLSSMNVNEYSDKKSVDRARYLFFHGKVHFMLLTERFFFYKRYSRKNFLDFCYRIKLQLFLKSKDTRYEA